MDNQWNAPAPGGLSGTLPQGPDNQLHSGFGGAGGGGLGQVGLLQLLQALLSGFGSGGGASAPSLYAPLSAPVQPEQLGFQWNARSPVGLGGLPLPQGVDNQLHSQQAGDSGGVDPGRAGPMPPPDPSRSKAPIANAVGLGNNTSFPSPYVVPPTAAGPTAIGSNLQNMLNQMLGGAGPNAVGSNLQNQMNQMLGGQGQAPTPSGSSNAGNVQTQPGRQPKIGGSPISGTGIGSGIYGSSLGQGQWTKDMMDKVAAEKQFIAGLDPNKDWHSPDAVYSPTQGWVGGQNFTANEIQRMQAGMNNPAPRTKDYGTPNSQFGVTTYGSQNPADFVAPDADISNLSPEAQAAVLANRAHFAQGW